MVIAVTLVDVLGGIMMADRSMLSEKLDAVNANFRRVLDNLSPLTDVLT